ncbi:response regulator [Qipengyuania sediminis]|uniref:response regulator n=1 Tax=Qipengyuania sediminis TaxID=1532023 RepID=UPI00105A17F8|nr:response regulator [Qipengyuania sediminis]
MKPSKRRSAAVPGPAPLQLGRVLVVEDDPVLAMATEDILREGGVPQVEICPTTEAALEALRGERPDALILDVHLADRDDGWAVAELVETLGENSPRIVFATGSPQDIPPHIAELGAVLVKPYSPQALLDALREPTRRGLLSRLRGALS